MKPINFTEKIQDVVLELPKSKIDVRLEIDFGHHEDVWVFPPDSDDYRWALYFQMDWNKKLVEIKRALLGDGRNFQNLHIRLGFTRNHILTPKHFLEYLKGHCDQYSDLLK